MQLPGRNRMRALGHTGGLSLDMRLARARAGINNPSHFLEEARSAGVCFELPAIREEFDRINFLANWRSLSDEERLLVNRFLMFEPVDAFPESGWTIQMHPWRDAVVKILSEAFFDRAALANLIRGVDPGPITLDDEFVESLDGFTDSFDEILSHPDFCDESDTPDPDDLAVEIQAPDFEDLD